jgi:hypothetical protein
MKQSYRHLFLILGTLFTVFGLLLFSFDNITNYWNILAGGLIYVGIYMLYKMLQSTPQVKVNKVTIVESIDDLNNKKNRFKKEGEITLNDSYKTKD